MAEKGLQELYVDELKDLYSAENQLVKALPKMAKAASSEKLRSGFEEHLEQTKGHVSRLEQIFKSLRESPTGKKCKGMEGLIEEGSEIIDEDLRTVSRMQASSARPSGSNIMRLRLTARSRHLRKPLDSPSTHLC